MSIRDEKLNLTDEEKTYPTSPRYLFWTGKMSTYIRYIAVTSDLRNLADLIELALFCARKYDELILNEEGINGN
jgi:hypothetical protein